MASLSEILKRQIASKSVSKSYLATVLNVGDKTISNYMNGTREPNIEDLVKLSVALDFSLDELKEQNVPRGIKKIPDVKPGIKEVMVLLVSELKIQNDILKKGFNLNDDLQNPLEVQALPPGLSERSGAGSGGGKEQTYKVVKKK